MSAGTLIAFCLLLPVVGAFAVLALRKWPNAREAATLVADLPQPCGDLVLRPVRIADEVQEAVLLLAEAGELSLHPGA